MFGLRVRLLALVAAIALMLPSGAAARASYFCRMMERAMPACCCAHAKGKQTKREASVQAPSCCDRLTAPSRAQASAAVDRSLEVPAAVLATVLPDFLALPPPGAVTKLTVPMARAPPSLGPPLFLAHCAFLI
jgi:hypothetical protein